MASDALNIVEQQQQLPHLLRGSPKPKYIKQMNDLEKRRFLDSFDIVFCDCDGVLWHTFRDAIPGSAEAIAWLRARGKHVVFVTNNSLCTTDEHLRKFALCNIAVTKHELLHPAQTICDYLRKLHFDGLILCLASSAFKQQLCQSGFQLATEQSHSLSESVQELRAAIYVPEPVKAVVIDVDFNMTAAKLMRAHVHLKQSSDCLFLGGAADALVPFGGIDVIGSGPFIHIVEQSTKREATILGKPGRALGSLLKERYADLQRQPQRALFIGDSLTSDIQFGYMCGFQTLLVLTGGTSELELNRGGADIWPDFVADSLADLKDLIC